MNLNYDKSVKEDIDNLLKAGFIAEVERSDDKLFQFRSTNPRSIAGENNLGKALALAHSIHIGFE